MNVNSTFFKIFGIIILSVALAKITTWIPTVIGMKNIGETDLFVAVKETAELPKKNELVGSYKVKDDKASSLIINEDGSYILIINVCEKYLELNGTYNIRDTKLKLSNTNYSYEDLNGNEELTFTIIDGKTLKAEESLVCTPQESLFEK